MKPSVILAGTIAVPHQLLTDEEFEADRQALSVPNPAFVQAQKQKRRRLWAIPERIHALSEDADHAHYPPGARELVLARLRGRACLVEDQRPTFDPRPLLCSTSLRPDQEAMVQALSGQREGVAIGPCGFGKGEVIVALTARVGVPTLIVVGQTDQQRELVERFRARCGIEVGTIGGGRFDVRNVTIALVQSLTPERLASIEARFGMAIVDECHHASAPSYVRVLHTLRVRHRYGFTATPRVDGLWPLVLAWLGPVRHEITRADLLDAGVSSSATYHAVPTGFVGSYRTREDWGPLLESLVGDADRNRLIVETVARHCRGEVGAVITGRVAHAEELARLAAERGLRAAVLTGSVKAAARTKVLAAARAGELDVIVATQLFDEGIDVPRLSRVYLAFPSKAEPRFVQRIGRALRVHAEKAAPLVFDFHDPRVGVLRHQASCRAEIFARVFGPTQEAA